MLAIFAASYCDDRQCVGCHAVDYCSEEFGRLMPDIEDWEQLIMEKLNEESYKDKDGDVDGQH